MPEAPAATPPHSGSRATIEPRREHGRRPAEDEQGAGDGRARRLSLEADLESLEARHGIRASLAT